MKITQAVLPAAMAALALGALTIPALAQQRGQMSWSGRVDETAIVALHGDNVDTHTIRGRSTQSVNEQVFGRLPDRPTHVFLRDVNGRGSVRIVQQPSFSNNFTARVRISDPQSGRGYYHFVLAWRPEFGGPGGPGGSFFPGRHRPFFGGPPR